MIVIIVAISILQQRTTESTTKVQQLEHSNKQIVDRSSFNHKIALRENQFPDKEIMAYGFGLRLYNSKGDFMVQETIQLDGSNYIYASIVNSTDKESEIGILLVIDGIPQRFFVDQQTDSDYIFRLSLQSNSLVNIPFLAKSLEISNGNNHTLSIVMLYDLEKMPNPTQPYIDFYTNTLIKQVTFSKNINIKSRVSLEFKDKSEKNMITSPGRGVTTKINIPHKELNYNSSNQILKMVDSSKRIVISNRAPVGTYSSILLIDNKPVTVDDRLNYYWKSNGVDHISIFGLNLKDEFQTGDHSLFQITIPVSVYIPYTYGSSKQVLSIQD
ncbi:hypothetical protein DFQ01_101288 [Paenibacillus cellulosilyticus]|uniref:Uncharacterized protein n=1 Tax=Paenibacillus cellulosilyticus TaxID=375489 RepID=A0A2V2Z091_9BACL|nr:hypothetical protein [Paenibacillus cellulosilyticus]PWW08565.1 hypothetical protein DFQ01_101288 [Paenibacillus cellulosilyticus]